MTLQSKDYVDLFCPICGGEIKVSFSWEVERGEFGTVLSQYPVLTDDPEQIDRQGNCWCDFNQPLAQAIAEYYNDGDRLYDLIFPVSQGEPGTENGLDEVEIESTFSGEKEFNGDSE